jgi:hypothetical protein
VLLADDPPLFAAAAVRPIHFNPCFILILDAKQDV